MKKVIIAAVCAFSMFAFSSCSYQSPIEQAYENETLYKACKQDHDLHKQISPGKSLDDLKQDFIDTYMELSEMEKANYKAYRDSMDNAIHGYMEKYERELSEAENLLNE